MAVTKKSKRKHGVSEYRCYRKRGDRRCDGEIITWYHKNWYIYPDSTTRQYQIWTCRACGYEYREWLPRTIIFDPANHQPLVGQHTLKAALDPYRAI